MPIEIRNIALRHESMLADLRKQAFENRQLKKSTYYAIARTKEVISATDDGMRLGIPSCATKPVATYAAAAP